MNEKPRHLVSDIHRYTLFIGVGMFITLFQGPHGFGKRPLQIILKEELGLPATAVASFFLLGTVSWYTKPLWALLSDRIPLFGTRRKHYLLISALAGAGLWGVTGALPRTYGVLLVAIVAVSAMAALANTVLGALLVEQGRAHGATSQLLAVREAVLNGVIVVAGPVGAWLAERAFGLTCAVGSLSMLVLALATALLLREHRSAVRVEQRRRLRLSRKQLASIVMMFLFCVAPSCNTVALYYQRDVLGLSIQTTGTLLAINGGSGILGAILYVWLRQRFRPRSLLIPGIVINAVGSLLYLFYRSPALAFAVEAGNGFLGILGYMPVQDLAVRASPRDGEAWGYALVMTAGSLGVGVSEVLGATLAERFHLSLGGLGCLNALATMLAVVVAVPFLRQGDRGNSAEI